MKKQVNKRQDTRVIELNKAPGSIQPGHLFTDQRPEFSLQSKSIEAIREHTASFNANPSMPIQRDIDWSLILKLVAAGSLTLVALLCNCYKRGITPPKEVAQDLITAGSGEDVPKEKTRKARKSRQNTGKSTRRQKARLTAYHEVTGQITEITDTTHSEKKDIVPEGSDRQEIAQTPVPEEIPKVKEKAGFETDDPESLDSRILNAPTQAKEARLYLKGIRKGGIWGGYTEANIIATQRDFGTRIFQGTAPNLQLMANIGNQEQRRNLDLLFTGNHYVVINAQQQIVFNPTADGNCMFEAMFYIMRDGAYAPQEAYDIVRCNAIMNTRTLAALGLEQLPPAELEQMAHDYAEERRNLFIHDSIIRQILKQFPPESFTLQFNNKGKTITIEDVINQKKQQKTTHQLLKSIDMRGMSLAGVSKKLPNLLNDLLAYYAPKPKVQGKASGQSTAPDDNKNGFRVEQSAIIYSFLKDLQVGDSTNLKNCSEHLNEASTSSFHYEKETVCHYSRGKSNWGDQFTVFYVFTDETHSRVRIIGVGRHEGKNPRVNKYVLLWGIGGQWTKGAHIDLDNGTFTYPIK